VAVELKNPNFVNVKIIHRFFTNLKKCDYGLTEMKVCAVTSDYFRNSATNGTSVTVILRNIFTYSGKLCLL